MICLTKSQVERLLHDCLPNGKIIGTDSNGGKYDNSIDTLWELFNSHSNKERNVDTNSKNDEWYMKAYDYWESSENCPVTDNGVLGGFGHLTPMDARDSLLFLDKLKEIRPNFQFNLVAGKYRIVSVLFYLCSVFICLELVVLVLAPVPMHVYNTP